MSRTITWARPREHDILCEPRLLLHPSTQCRHGDPKLLCRFGISSVSCQCVDDFIAPIFIVTLALHDEGCSLECEITHEESLPLETSYLARPARHIRHMACQSVDLWCFRRNANTAPPRTHPQPRAHHLASEPSVLECGRAPSLGPGSMHRSGPNKTIPTDFGSSRDNSRQRRHLVRMRGISYLAIWATRSRLSRACEPNLSPLHSHPCLLPSCSRG